MRNERDKAIEAAARALLGMDASDIGSDPRADLRAALALPDAPAPAPSPWVGDCGIGSGPATHPPTDAAAAERAEIVAMLRARATSEQVCADRAQAEPDKTRMTYERIVAYTHSASILREEADRIAARGPGPVWTEARVRAVAEAVRDVVVGVGEVGDPDPDLDAIIARVRKGAT